MLPSLTSGHVHAQSAVRFELPAANLTVATRMAANPNLLAGLSVIIQGEFHPVTLIQLATQLDKMGD